MNYDQRARMRNLLLAFAYGALMAGGVAVAVWHTWGRDAVRLSCKAPAADPPDIAEQCMAFWFGADPREKFDVLKRMCPRPRDSRRVTR